MHDPDRRRPRAWGVVLAMAGGLWGACSDDDATYEGDPAAVRECAEDRDEVLAIAEQSGQPAGDEDQFMERCIRRLEVEATMPDDLDPGQPPPTGS